MKYRIPDALEYNLTSGEDLIQRKDDNETALHKRLDGYRNMTNPILKYYADQNALKSVDASKSISEIWGQVQNAMQ